MFGNCTLQRNCLANFTHICTKQKLSVSTKTSFAQQVENRICASVTSGGSRILERGFQFLAKAPALEDQKRRSSTFILPALSAMCDAFSLHASFPINFLFYTLETIPFKRQQTTRAAPALSNKVYILNDYTSDYKTRISKLNLLPLMYILDISDIMFAIKSLKSPTNAFFITDHITFASGYTRLGSSNKLQHSRNFNVTSSNFFFNRLPRIWNALPIIDLNLNPPTIKYKLTNFLWNYFKHNFNPDNACTFSFACPCISRISKVKMQSQHFLVMTVHNNPQKNCR